MDTAQAGAWTGNDIECTDYCGCAGVFVALDSHAIKRIFRFIDDDDRCVGHRFRWRNLFIANLGPGPRDGLMTGINEKTGWPIAGIRSGLEVSVVVLGVALGGSLGLALYCLPLVSARQSRWASTYASDCSEALLNPSLKTGRHCAPPIRGKYANARKPIDQSYTHLPVCRLHPITPGPVHVERSGSHRCPLDGGHVGEFAMARQDQHVACFFEDSPSFNQPAVSVSSKMGGIRMWKAKSPAITRSLGTTTETSPGE